MGLRVKYLKELIKKSGIKQKDFALKIGYKDPQSFYSSITRNNMGMDKIYRAADILSVEVRDIYEFENEVNEDQVKYNKPQNHIDMTREMFLTLKDQLEFLKDQIKFKDKEIDRLIDRKSVV